MEKQAPETKVGRREFRVVVPGETEKDNIGASL